MRILQENEVPDFDVAEPPTMLDRLKRASVYTDPPVNRTNRSLEKWREDLRKQQVLSEDDLARNAQLPAWVRKHLKEERGLDDLTILTWELGYNASRNRLVVPIRNKDGALVGMSGRAMGKAQPKYLHSKGFRRDLVLYGEHRLLDSQRGYLHEGFFAVQSATMRGYTNSVARMGTHLSEAQADLIIHTFTDLVIVPDGDQPGFESAQQIAEQLQNRITVTVAPMPQGSEVETLSNADALKILGPLPSSLTTP
jgi:DNA primase